MTLVNRSKTPLHLLFSTAGSQEILALTSKTRRFTPATNQAQRRCLADRMPTHLLLGLRRTCHRGRTAFFQPFRGTDFPLKTQDA